MPSVFWSSGRALTSEKLSRAKPSIHETLEEFKTTVERSRWKKLEPGVFCFLQESAPSTQHSTAHSTAFHGSNQRCCFVLLQHLPYFSTSHRQTLIRSLRNEKPERTAFLCGWYTVAAVAEWRDFQKEFLSWKVRQALSTDEEITWKCRGYSQQRDISENTGRPIGSVGFPNAFMQHFRPLCPRVKYIPSVFVPCIVSILLF